MKPTQAQIKLALAYQAPTGHQLRVFNKPTIKKSRAKRGKPEEILQEALCQYLDTQPRIQYWANNPQVFLGKLTWARIKYLEKLKRMGHKKGIPDLCLKFLNKKGVGTFCFAEVKSLCGTATDEQSDNMLACEARGGFTAIVKSLDDLIELLKAAGY